MMAVKARTELLGRPRHYQQGFSLLEILVAMALGLILLAGATNLFIGSSRTFNANESLSRMQEDTRYVMNRMSRDLRMAGFRGCAPNSAIINGLDQTKDEYYAEFYGGNRILGWDYQGADLSGDILTLGTPLTNSENASDWADSTSPDGSGTLPVNSTVFDSGLAAGSDVLISNRAIALGDVEDVTSTGVTIRFDTEYDLPQSGIAMMVSGDCTQAELFQQSNSSTAGNLNITKAGGNIRPGNIDNAYAFNAEEEDAEFYDFLTTAYFVRVNDDGIPGLYERRVDASGGNTREIARGVESMQVRYGIAASDNTTIAQTYVTADQVTTWDNVVSVRISLLVRSRDPVNNQPNTNIYNLSGTQVIPSGADGTGGAAGDGYLRVAATKTITLRNRVR